MAQNDVDTVGGAPKDPIVTKFEGAIRKAEEAGNLSRVDALTVALKEYQFRDAKNIPDIRLQTASIKVLGSILREADVEVAGTSALSTIVDIAKECDGENITRELATVLVDQFDSPQQAYEFFADLNEEEISRLATMLPSQRIDAVRNLMKRDRQKKLDERRTNPDFVRFLNTLPDDDFKQEYIKTFEGLDPSKRGSELAFLASLTDEEVKVIATISDPEKRRDELQRLRSLTLTTESDSLGRVDYDESHYSSRQWRQLEREGRNKHMELLIEKVPTSNAKSKLRLFLKGLTSDEAVRFKALLAMGLSIDDLSKLSEADMEVEIKRLASITPEEASSEFRIKNNPLISPKARKYFLALPLNEREKAITTLDNESTVLDTISDSEIARLVALPEEERAKELMRLANLDSSLRQVENDRKTGVGPLVGLIEHEQELYSLNAKLYGEAHARLIADELKKMSTQERARYQAALCMMTEQEGRYFRRLANSQARNDFINMVLDATTEGIKRRKNNQEQIDGLSRTELLFVARSLGETRQRDIDSIRELDPQQRERFNEVYANVSIHEIDEIASLPINEAQARIGMLFRLTHEQLEVRKQKLDVEHDPNFDVFSQKLGEYHFNEMSLDQQLVFLRNPRNIDEIRKAFPGISVDKFITYYMDRNRRTRELETKPATADSSIREYYDSLLKSGKINQAQYDTMITNLSNINLALNGFPDNFWHYCLNAIGINDEVRASFANIADVLKIYSPEIIHQLLTVALAAAGIITGNGWILLGAGVVELGGIPISDYLKKRNQVLYNPVLVARKEQIESKSKFVSDRNQIIGTVNEVAEWLKGGKTMEDLKVMNLDLFERAQSIGVVSSTGEFKPENVVQGLINASETYRANINAVKKAVDARKQSIKAKKTSEVLKMSFAPAAI